MFEFTLFYSKTCCPIIYLQSLLLIDKISSFLSTVYRVYAFKRKFPPMFAFPNRVTIRVVVACLSTISFWIISEL